MDNNTFRKWLSWKLREAEKDLASGKLSEGEKEACKEAVKWLKDANRMAVYASGLAFRRFRKDYERRLARRGVLHLRKYEEEGAKLREQ